MDNLKKEFNQVSKTVAKEALQTADILESGVEKTVTDVDRYVEPIRLTVFRRYPILFSVLVLSGAVITTLGFEYILHRYSILVNHPWLVFLTGLVILTFTGGLYKNLKNKL
ncbi:MAG: hypothetical protein H6779_05235 [Candidatus Nomurabacteria bacterium]|nr:MAG: hypothetical protein H6779_05235 [Candidatus Nomurabacteria bacterium]